MTVTNGAKYAIVSRATSASAPSASAPNIIHWMGRYPDPSHTTIQYDGGNAVRGYQWAPELDKDFSFEVLGGAATTKPLNIQPTPGLTKTTPATSSINVPAGMTTSGTSLVAESGIAAPGEKTSVPIRLDNAQNVGSFGFQLDYDPSVAQVTNVTNGSLTSGASFTYNILKPGTILFGYANSAGISGSGPTALIEFNALGNDGSKCNLKLSAISAINTSKNAMTLNPVNGIFSIGHKLLGDGNGDNQITVVDALIALKMYVKAIPEDLNMDVDNDGKVTHEDAFQIMSMAKPTTAIQIFKG